MTKESAGILLYRLNANKPEVLLVHPGGPFWKNKDEGAWSIPKGELETGEDPLQAARREFQEETGSSCDGEFIPLAPVKMKSGKRVYAWALEMNLDVTAVQSSSFEMEWPPRSGKKQTFPEIDQAAWFSISVATKKINAGLAALLKDLQQQLKDHV